MSEKISSKVGKIKAPFLAFVTQEADVATVKKFAEARRWSENCVQQGDIKTATEFLKNNPSPSLLLVEVPSATAAPELLSVLADVCDEDTQVVVTGNINEYSFYCWLTEIGIFSYLLKPLTLETLDQTWEKAYKQLGNSLSDQNKGKFIGVMGMRGGVGASSIALYLATLIAENKTLKVGLVDMDPQDGSISLLLDLEPSKGLREVLDRPDRIDGLFLDRVMQESGHGFKILSAEEPIVERMQLTEPTQEALLRELGTKFDYIILDLPCNDSSSYRKCLQSCNHIVAVTDYSLLGLRDCLRINDLFRDYLHLAPPLFVANRVGIAPKLEMKPEEFAKGLGAKIEHQIPFAPDVFMSISAELPGLKTKSPALKVLRELVDTFITPEVVPEEKSQKKPLFGWMKGK